MQIAIVKYQIATYSGKVKVPCKPDDEHDHIVAKARNILRLRSGGSLPFGYESFTILSRD